MRVVCIGASHASLTAAGKLRHLLPNEEIILVNRSETFVPSRMISHLITGEDHPHLKALSLPAICERIGVRFLCASIQGIEPSSKAILINGERFAYDALIVDLPSEPLLSEETTHGNISLAGENSAHALRRHAVEQIKNLRANNDEASRNFFVVGSGVYGLETASHLHKLTNDAAREHFVFPHELRHTVLNVENDGSEHIPVKVSEKVRNILSKRGIDWRKPSHVKYEHARITTDGRVELTNTIVWTGAHRGSRIFFESGLAVNENGYLAVDKFLRTTDPRIFAIGRSVDEIEGKTLVHHRSVRAQEREGKVAAHNAAATIIGATLKPYKKPSSWHAVSLGGPHTYGWSGPFYWHGPFATWLHLRRERIQDLHERKPY